MITNTESGKRESEKDMVCSNVLTQDSLDSIEREREMEICIYNPQ
jgi:hypothetical protein